MLGHTIEEAHAFAHLAEFLMDRIIYGYIFDFVLKTL